VIGRRLKKKAYDMLNVYSDIFLMTLVGYDDLIEISEDKSILPLAKYALMQGIKPTTVQKD